MNLKNTKSTFGLVSIILHWAIAILIIILIPLGLWMTSLDYYDSWYTKAPDIHRSLGIIVGIFILLYIMWRKFNIKPANNTQGWEKILSNFNHIFLSASAIFMLLSGYLISTADGKPVAVFNWFSIPSLLSNIENQADIAGWFHYLFGLFMIALILLHVAGALKHHFIDKDQTLKKMFGITGENK